MLALTRYRVPVEDAVDFHTRARAALQALASRPGHVMGVVGRATDDPGLWTLTTLWESVGAYRRALGAYDVKLVAHPLMYLAIDEPSAFEALDLVERDGPIREQPSDRAPNADTADLGDALP